MRLYRILLCVGRECDQDNLAQMIGTWASLRVAHSRQEALNIANREEIDCVILDLGTLSWDVTVLLEEFVNRVIPVVAIADREKGQAGLQFDGVEIMRLGALDYLYLEEVSEERLKRAVSNGLAKNNLRKELLAKQKELEDFAYVASHDLNAPLYKIRQCCDLLVELFGSQLPEKAYRLLGIVERSCVQMNDLINDLLDYSRVSRLGKSFRRINLNELVEEVIVQVRELYPDREAEFEVKDLPTLEANSTAMHQLFHNLLTNAVKYNESSKACIVVQAKEDSDPEFVRIEVVDNGMGVETKYQDRIFDPFERLHAQGEIPGSGLGLAICKRIASYHGGTIWYRSNEEQGSVFCVRLAKRPEATPVHEL